ncbi:MAG TPA: protein kinase [Polyangiaceae bacterium]|nr:protein kinase [Polyangiaceae bacterium]
MAGRDADSAGHASRDTVPDGARTTVPLLQLVGLAKSFGRVDVLKDVCFSADAGDIVGLCGENGSGKSTLVKILAGVHAHGSYAGEIRLDGKRLVLSSPHDSQRAGIAVVHQRLMLVPELSVAQNVMLGREPRRFGLVDEARLESEARQLLERFGLADVLDPAMPVGSLSAGLQQIVEILRGLAHNAKILVLDEPTASLLPRERERLLTWLRTLKSTGTTCIYVSQRMDEVFGLCDRIAVLRDGRTAETLVGAPSSPRLAEGRYTIYDEIASGGMATVHLGKARGAFGFSNTVAIKRLFPQMAKDPEFVAMFLDEARLASRVRHPNVVTVLDVLSEGGELCLVMEYVEGESLSVLCRALREARKPIPIPIAVAITSSILHGLHAAHQATDQLGVPLGLVHRDVSPQNVIVGVDGVARLIDFGIAKAAGRSSVSRDGQLKGKIPYMAPEQIQGGVINHRTDIYGAAVILWELLSGERLFDGETQGIILGLVLDDVVHKASEYNPLVSAELDALTLRGLDRDSSRRFDSARAFALELEALVRPAMPAEVSEWVHVNARASLALRSEKLARMERQASAVDDAPPRSRPS